MSARSTTDALGKSFEMRQGMAQLFEAAMRDGRTPPLDALLALAEALGTVYRDMARAHLDPAGCPCGWQPAAADLRALGAALREGAEDARRERADLRAMEPAGRA